MVKISSGEKLEIENLLSFRGKISQNEIDNIGRDMETQILKAGLKKIGNPITVTHSVEGALMEIELLIPVDKRVNDVEKYKFKEKIKIVNALKLSYKGHPNGLQNACNQLNNYILENNMQPITVGYNVTRHIDIESTNNTEIDVYVGISPNVL